MQNLSRQKKFLGQHFLHDARILEQIVSFIAPQPSDHLVEIGPGDGALTTKLLGLVNSMDVIEIDREIIPSLEKNCENQGNLSVHRTDALQMNFGQLVSPFRLVGNLPYNISTPLLFRTIDNINLITDLHFMLQKEVAARIVAVPGTKIYGRLSVMLQYYYEVKLLLHVAPQAFFPPPKVNSAFIRLTPRKCHSVTAQDEKLFSDIVRAAFNQRRKMIINSLKQHITAAQLEQAGIDPRSRPEQLPAEDFVLLSNQLLK